MKLSKFYTLFTLGLLVFSQMSAQIPAYVPTNGLVGWYPFNGNANDESGKGTNGSVSGATLTTDRYNKLNSAYSFSATNKSNIDLGQNSAINGLLNDFTITYWINNTSGDGVVFSSYSTQQGSYWRFNFYAGVSGLESGFLIGGSAGTWQKSPSKYSLAANNWDNVTVVRKGNNLKTYVNNIIVANNTVSTSSVNNPTSPSASTKIGSNIFGTEFITGKIDDFGFWNRALDSSEISKLYTGCIFSLTNEPTNQSLNINSQAQFTALASDTTVSYQWQSNASNMGWSNIPSSSFYTGVATKKLTINNVQVNNHKQLFRVIATKNTCKDTSAEAKIIITDTCINTKSISVADTLKFAVNLTGVAPPNNRNAMKVYPNPTNSAVVIDNGNFTAMANYIVKIENSIGQQVFFSKVTQQQFTVDVSTLGGKGVYTLTVLDPAGKLLETKKIVLN